ncbi:adenosylmethionine--8-amino-7-oxononanoate transaminase [Flavobacterium psychrophilum]|uniref:Adenosylmethionine-8-amino-7-oxononanoate aminotransferase n=1 Tax=Flavobacterium psychrophilum TaxID=96345 RepID=A0A7U2R9J6_FLAPS|nr:adenosylmethionine--8-amino-7-oxononanoate transaminase [Flavobacterium psychrophilum]EKT3967056.1 adenosylmethionine--8-amino-7-oxononanoate transaminase [Flavobacterium psychrophilum]EKT4498587.1 adenosylmethionine--8-amino-7-oxononanoate transaminase [Flavobacterium psychrophilum]EKT4510473.1 adenosylmethionine--8-amino-7-oxononanoate transaminase [Flavobacterium psychrophilum]EKT4519058.1 adenosylmethionine--8-amino-7-oxononanoate transaminase [Flavobacterium psychrophilum]ELI6454908.1 
MNLSERDQKHNWHPYTQHKISQPEIAITKGKGALLWDDNNKEYIDAIASWWVNPYGHSNQIIANAIYKQLTTLEHVLFGGFTHEPAVLLSEKLIEILPDNQQKIFYSDNGSTAVEIAIKVAMQYFYNKNEKRTTIIAFENAFHGDTFGAMAASGISFFTEAFNESLIQVIRIPVPTAGNEKASAIALTNAIKEHHCATFIFEPLVQGAAGMVMYEASELDKLIKICKENQVFTIADEVMTGFGKTGKTFACNYLAQKPDMMCLSKALTGGTIPMAITTFTQEIFDGFYDDDVNKALFHGHTFTANPTGCAAALASIQLLKSDEMQENIKRVNTQHLQFQETIKRHEKVKTTRVLGVIFALEIKTNNQESYYGNLRNKLYNFFIKNGIIMRPVGNIIYILPPYIITNEQLQKVYQTIQEALEIV